MTPFRRRVLAAVAGLPEGVVVTYGEVANEIGHPGAARAVGSALRDAPPGLPWWRVVPASGRLVDHLVDRQSALLRAEGVEVADGRVAGMSGQIPTPSAAASYRGRPRGEQD